MRSRTLKFKVVLYLALALTLAMLVFTLLVVRHQRDEMLREAVSHVAQISEVIKKSTRFAMLTNQPNYVDRIIRDVGNQGSIEKVRILSKDGSIIHSSYLPEIGFKVDRKAEACVLCHLSEASLEQVPQSQRSRIFATPEGRRMLGSMDVIRNEPSCYTANCHQHSKSMSVLGVLDIVYSLDDIDRKMRTSAITMVALSLGFIVIAALSVGFFVHRLVYVPLRDLETGARRLATGNLEQTIPVRSEDEFGQLAASFNAMTVALRNSQSELREWGHTLEQKVAKRTQELRIAEAETVRTEKLASVGLLAAGIAHELNNPLTGVLTFTSLLRQKMTAGSADAEDLDLVIRETKRCATIIRRLLDFAREKAPEKKFTDLNQVIEDTARIIERPASFRDIEIALDLDRNLPVVWVDADLIKQVMMNMLVNAQHAIEQEGSITVRSRRFAQPKSPEPGMEPVPMVEISIIDTGCGIPEKNLKRIFDPFFTSKEVGKGTGLGLSVSHGIVKAHGGTIEVESTVGKGSIFRVYLPLEPSAGAAASSRSNQ
ncbi:MAG: HAMP domain-containing protein [Betaproteobacteria bacterium]|nr:MAG: HAMP domain-containing protein [Betaproteobacteria bacterium]